MDEIVENLEAYLDMYRNHVVFLRGKICRSKQEAGALLHVVTSTLNEMKDKNEKLVEERNWLKQKIEQDVHDLKNFEDEKNELLNQVRELEVQNVRLMQILDERKHMLGSVEKKVELISERSAEKEVHLHAKVMYFKKYLGISIIPVEENVIKVVFGKICADDDVECFVVLDLSRNFRVVDVFPRVSDPDKLNLLSKGRGFHEFLKALRCEFKAEYSGIHNTSR